MHEAFYILLAVFVVREYLFQKNTHQLLDKLMSRNYYDYQISQRVNDPKPSPAPVIDDFQEPDTLGSVHPFT